MQISGIETYLVNGEIAEAINALLKLLQYHRFNKLQVEVIHILFHYQQLQEEKEQTSIEVQEGLLRVVTQDLLHILLQAKQQLSIHRVSAEALLTRQDRLTLLPDSIFLEASKVLINQEYKHACYWGQLSHRANALLPTAIFQEEEVSFLNFFILVYNKGKKLRYKTGYSTLTMQDGKIIKEFEGEDWGNGCWWLKAAIVEKNGIDISESDLSSIELSQDEWITIDVAYPLSHKGVFESDAIQWIDRVTFQIFQDEYQHTVILPV